MVNIEIDGIPLKVDATKMIIQAADEAGIDIPRFCYHKKLSIAANCRMCLIEVDKSRKALPACATPVTEGMKVFTHSKTAIDAQRSVMEFLLINHPLDCPICDQGGECELQDLSMGYGSGLGRFSEGKRVVKDKNIGPLITTDMTRCIHCTRCVRFGEEIAGIKELGATGRGEHMEIGTYIESSLISELSGNIIDLCPVGALTSKPYRYRARAWELVAHPSIAPHDAVGSNIEFHINHEQRATEPMIKQNGEWQVTDWQTALAMAADSLKALKTKHGAKQIAGVISPTATLEEAYLFQKLLRGLGSNNVDHRLRQQSFTGDSTHYNHQNWSLTDIEQSDDIVLVGCNIRAEQPIIAHRIRQAATMGGTTVTDINFFKSDLLMPVTAHMTVNIKGMLSCLSGIAKALIALGGKEEKSWVELLENVTPKAADQTIAMRLSNARQATLCVGALANNHPQAAKLRALTALIARLTNSQLIVLPTANSTAIALAGDLSQDKVKASEAELLGLDSEQIWQQKLRAYLLFGVEPELDCADANAAQHALQHASLVVSITSYVTDTILAYADVILPMASFAETSGTFIGVDGQWQSFTGAVTAKADSRPGWKILRVLGNLANIKGFDYVSSLDIRDEVSDKYNLQSSVNVASYIPESLQVTSTLMVISEVPMYQTDAVVRRSSALQQTPENQRASLARMNSKEAEKYGLSKAKMIKVTQDDNHLNMAFEIDDAIADSCIYIAAGIAETSILGANFADVQVTIVEQGASL